MLFALKIAARRANDGGLGVVVGEEPPQPATDVLGGFGLGHDDVDDIVAVEVAGLSEEGLVAEVVLALVEEELGLALQLPAGEGPGRLADIVFGVVADAEAEEFHELAGVVLVGGRLLVGAAVEINHHRRVARDGLQQVAVPAHALGAEELVLLQRLRAVAGLLEGAGQDAVPEESDLLLEGALRVRHALEPPPLEVVEPAFEVEVLLGQAGFERCVVDGLEIDEAVDSGLQSHAAEARQLRLRGAEPGAP